MRKIWGIKLASCTIAVLLPAAMACAVLPGGSLFDSVPSLVYNADDGSLFIETGEAYGGPSALYNVAVYSYEGIFYPARASDIVGYATDYTIVTLTDWPLYDGTLLGEPNFIVNEAEWFLQDDLTFTFQVDPYGSVYTSDLVYYIPLPDLPGDLNDDGYVGLDDLDIILTNWNQTVPPADPRADVDGDGFVGLADLDGVLIPWNTGTPPVNAVPEPASALALSMMIGVGVLRRK